MQPVQENATKNEGGPPSIDKKLQLQKTNAEAAKNKAKRLYGRIFRASAQNEDLMCTPRKEETLKSDTLSNSSENDDRPAQNYRIVRIIKDSSVAGNWHLNYTGNYF